MADSAGTEVKHPQKLHTSKQSSSRSKSFSAEKTSEAQSDGEWLGLQRWWVLDNVEVPKGHKDTASTSIFDDSESSAASKVVFPFMVLNPLARWRIFWDLTVMVLVVYNLVMVPYKLAFVETQRARFPERSLPELYLDLAIDVFFLLDILLNFTTSYEEINLKGESAFVTSRSQILWTYTRSWFVLDLSGSVPIDYILYLIEANDGETSPTLRSLKSLRVLKLVKLARMWRFGRFVGKLRETFDVNPAVITLLQMLGAFMVIAHALSCYFFYMGALTEIFRTCKPGVKPPSGADNACLCDVSIPIHEDVNCTATTWLTTYSFMMDGEGPKHVWDSRMFSQYMITMYWVMSTMSTVGYGDLQPTTELEVVMCIVAQIIGATTFGFIVGNMATLADALKGRGGELKEKLDVLHSFLDACNVPVALQKRVILDLNHQYVHPIALIRRSIIELVPEELGVDVARSTYRAILDDVTMFLGLDMRSLNQLYLKLRPLHAAPGDRIANTGDPSRSIVFVLSGHVHLYKTTYKEYTQAGLEAFQSSDCVVSLFSGNFFGENCLLPPDDNLQFTAVAAEWSDLLILDLRDIVATLSEEEELVFVRLSAKLRYEKFLFLVKASLALRQIKANAPEDKLEKSSDGAKLSFFGAAALIPRREGSVVNMAEDGPVDKPPEGGDAVGSANKKPSLSSPWARAVQPTATKSTPMRQLAVEATRQAGSKSMPEISLDRDSMSAAPAPVHGVSAAPFISPFSKQGTKRIDMGVPFKSMQQELLKQGVFNEEERKLINMIYGDTRAGDEPDWDKILASEWIGTEMMALTEQHGSLQKAENEVAPDSRDAMVMLDGLRILDQFGKPSRDRIEHRLKVVLRRLQAIENVPARPIAVRLEDEPEYQAAMRAALDAQEEEDNRLIEGDEESGEGDESTAVPKELNFTGPGRTALSDSEGSLLSGESSEEEHMLDGPPLARRAAGGGGAGDVKREGDGEESSPSASEPRMQTRSSFFGRWEKEGGGNNADLVGGVGGAKAPHDAEWSGSEAADSDSLEAMESSGAAMI